MKQFEYLIEMTDENHKPDLEALGRSGWELVAVIPVHQERGFHDYKFYFKREVKK